MDWLIEPFTTAAQQRALTGGLIAALMLALVGTWVVIRGMTFLGDALAHGVIPGIALAILFDVNLLVGAIAAAVVIIYGIGLVHRQTTFSEDTGIGLLFVGMLSAGVMILSRLPDYDEELTHLLFGEVEGVSVGQIVILSVMAIVTLIVSLVFYRPFLVLAFNEQKAQMLGLRPPPGSRRIVDFDDRRDCLVVPDGWDTPRVRSIDRPGSHRCAPSPARPDDDGHGYRSGGGIGRGGACHQLSRQHGCQRHYVVCSYCDVLHSPGNQVAPLGLSSAQRPRRCALCVMAQQCCW